MTHCMIAVLSSDTYDSFINIKNVPKVILTDCIQYDIFIGSNRMNFQTYHSISAWMEVQDEHRRKITIGRNQGS